VQGEPLEKVQLEKVFDGFRFSIADDELRWEGTVNSVGDLSNVVAHLMSFFQLLLNVYFVDAVWVSDIYGTVGEIPFELWLAEVDGIFDVVDVTLQRERFEKTLAALASGTYQVRRLLGALDYLYVANRLRQSSEFSGEFLSEVIVNMAKVLLALFDHPSLNPPKIEDQLGHSMDRVRNGLARVGGYSTEEVEKIFIPCVAIRNNYDGAHPSLRLFNGTDTALLHRYIRVALPKMRELVKRLLESGEAIRLLPPYDIAAAAEGQDIQDKTFVLLREWYPQP
jgi:hypothetical protein